MPKARSNGEGSLYQRHDHSTCPRVGPDGTRAEHRCRGRWEGALVDDGQRSVFYGASKAEVRAAMTSAQRRLESGAPVKDAKASLESVVLEWVTSTLAASARKPSTATYATLLRSQVLPDVIPPASRSPTSSRPTWRRSRCACGARATATRPSARRTPSYGPCWTPRCGMGGSATTLPRRFRVRVWPVPRRAT